MVAAAAVWGGGGGWARLGGGGGDGGGGGGGGGFGGGGSGGGEGTRDHLWTVSPDMHDQKMLLRVLNQRPCCFTFSVIRRSCNEPENLSSLQRAVEDTLAWQRIEGVVGRTQRMPQQYKFKDPRRTMDISLRFRA